MEDATKKKIIKWFWILVTAPFALILFLLLLVWMFAKIPSFEELEHPDSKLATQVIADGGEVLTTFHIENRTFVSYDELSPNLVAATIATEDARFRKHSGIDTKGLVRVAVKTILMRDSSQGGGSTITQQLAKTLYPRKEGVGKIGMVWIKLKEWITAVKLERNYTKDEILVMYLNSVFFGSSALIPAVGLTLSVALCALLTLASSWLLSRTLLPGGGAAFVLELPPYRRPRLGQVLLRSLLDRTLFVLGRAIAAAAPAGALLWLLGHWQLDGSNALALLANALEPLGRFLGLDGKMLLAFLLGAPANEIVLPSALMLYTAGTSLVAVPSLPELGALLTAQGWTVGTAVCCMLFALFHWPCLTTLLTVRRETHSLSWTVLAAALPTAIGVVLCAIVHFILI